MKIVLIDDSKSALAALDAAIGEIGGMETSTFADPEEALHHCLSSPVDLIIVDYTMPKYTGIELVEALKRNEAYRYVPIIMITSLTERAVRIEAIDTGVTEFLSKPFDPVELKARVRNLLALRRAHLELAGHAERLVLEVSHATAELMAREEEIIMRLARAIEYRDGPTGEHVSRVARISEMLAQDLGLDQAVCRMIYLAAPLHDIGKIGIPDQVLLKPGRLTPAEISQMRRHVAIGVGILEKSSSELLRIAEAIAGGHHEKWDGTGYPHGRSGEDIPLVARIVAVADVFEALCSARPYKRAWSPEEARDHIAGESGRHFDPRCVEAFLRRWPQISSLMAEPDRIVVPAPGIETPDEGSWPALNETDLISQPATE